MGQHREGHRGLHVNALQATEASLRSVIGLICGYCDPEVARIGVLSHLQAVSYCPLPASIQP